MPNEALDDLKHLLEAARVGAPQENSTLLDPRLMVRFALNRLDPGSWSIDEVQREDGTTATRLVYVSPTEEAEHLSSLTRSGDPARPPPSHQLPSGVAGTGHRAESRINVNSPDASAHRQRWDDSPSNLGGILSLLSMETTEARCHSLSSAITFHQFRKCLLESLFEFPKIAAAGQCLGPRDVNNLVDFGIDHRMS